MLDDPRVMHGTASGDIVTMVAQRCNEVSPLQGWAKVLVATPQSEFYIWFLPAAKPSRYSNCQFSPNVLRMFKKKPKMATLTSENVSIWSTDHEKIYGKVTFGLRGHLEVKIASKNFA